MVNDDNFSEKYSLKQLIVKNLKLIDSLLRPSAASMSSLQFITSLSKIIVFIFIGFAPNTSAIQSPRDQGDRQYMQLSIHLCIRFNYP